MDNKMNDFQQQVAAILGALPVWEQSNLNEAQTSQSIILRLLAAAGFDIWNPLEVFPEKNSGGKNSYVPDYTLYFENKHKVIVEVKALGKELNDTEKVQSLNYVNALGLRWVILTNGKQWIFLDNDLKGEAAKKVALTLNLLEPHAGEFLEELLQAQLWWEKDANSRVAEKVQLINIIVKLKEILSTEPEFPNDERGVRLAIRYELSAEDKNFATYYLAQILALLFPENEPLVEIQTAPITQLVPQIPEVGSRDVWQTLYENLVTVQQKSRIDISKMKDFYTIRFNEYQINMSSMPNIYEAVAETCLVFQLSDAIKLLDEQTRNLTIYTTTNYRQLSNAQYIFVGLDFSTSIKHIRKLLQALKLSAGSVSISSNNKGIRELP